MSGYAKRWAAEAAKWLVANPDPGDWITHFPADRRPVVDDVREFDEEIKRLAREENIDLSKSKRAERHTLSPEAQQTYDNVKTLRAELIDGKRRLDEQLSSIGKVDDDILRRLDIAISKSTPGASTVNACLEDIAPLLGPWLVRWARDGYNVFDLSTDFVTAMLLTDPSALDLSALRLPFAGLLLTIPDRFARSAQGGHFTKIHIYEQPLVTTTGELAAESDQAVRLMSLDATDGERWICVTVRFDDLAKDGIEALDDLDDRDDQAVLDTIRRVALGALVYFVSVERSASKRQSTPSRNVSAAPRPIYWDVARTVRIDPVLVSAARAGSREIAFRLKHRHIVRGHYRQQPIGEGRKDRKTIWIAPFWKGPANGAAIVHTYLPVDP